MTLESKKERNEEGYRFESIEKMIADLEGLSQEALVYISHQQWNAAASIVRRMKNIVGFGHPLAANKDRARALVQDAESFLSRAYKEATGNDIYDR
jgi:hypothetical protein